MKKPHQVSLLNQSFTIETDAADQHVKAVASFVNKKIKETQKQTQTASSLHVALLTCLNMADELIRYQDQTDERKNLAEKKIQDLLEIVDLQL